MSNLILNFKCGQKRFLDQCHDSNLLIYGPSNLNVEQDLENDLFRQFNFVFIHNGMLEVLKSRIPDIKNLKLIHVLNGSYSTKYKEKILADDHLINMYLVSEVHTMRVLSSYGISQKKIMHMTLNYEQFGVNGWPTMGPKLLMFIEFYKIKFRRLLISGYTFYLNDLLTNTYHLDYLDYKNLFDVYERRLKPRQNRSVKNLTEEEKTALIKCGQQQRIALEKTSVSRTGHSIYQGYNVFLRFYRKNKSRVDIDSPLTEIMTTYPVPILDNVDLIPS